MSKILGVHTLAPTRSTSQLYNIVQAGTALTNRNLEIEYNLGTATIRNYGAAIIVASDDAANTRTKFTASVACNVEIDFSGTVAATAIQLLIYKNGVAIINSGTINTVNFLQSISYAIQLNPGEYFSVGTETDFSNTSNVANLSFTATTLEEIG